MIERKCELINNLMRVLFLALIMLSGSALGHSSGTLHSDSERVTVSLDFASYQPSMDGAVSVTITKLNTSNKPIKVLRNLEEFKGWLKRDDVLKVSLDETILNYIGPQVKEVEPKKYDYIQLAPGDTHTSSFRIDSAYDFSAVGDYKIELLNRPGIELDQNNKSASIRVYFARKQLKRAPNFLACGAAEQSAADEGLRVAEIYGIQSRNAMNSTAEADRADSPRYTTWFGSYNSTRWDFVRSAYNKMASALSNQVITFNCACDANGIDPERVVAYVYGNRHYEINVCPLFFRYPTSGTNSKAGIIIHEMSHFEVIANTDDHVYGQSNTRNLAQSDPQQAIENADSFHYFSENPGNLPMVASSDNSGGGNNGSNGGDNSGNGGSVDEPNPPQEPTPPEPENYDYLTTIIGLLIDTPPFVYSDFDRPPLGTLDPALPEERSGKFNAVIHDDFGLASASNPKYEYSQSNANYTTRYTSGVMTITWAGYGKTSGYIATDDEWTLQLNMRDRSILKRGVYRNNVGEPHTSHYLSVSLRRGSNFYCEDGPISTETRIHDILLGSPSVGPDYMEPDSVERLKMDFIIYCRDDKSKRLSGSIEINESANNKSPDRSLEGKGDGLPRAAALSYRGTSVKLVRDNIYLGTQPVTEEYGTGEAIYLTSRLRPFDLYFSLKGKSMNFKLSPNRWDGVSYIQAEDYVGYYDQMVGYTSSSNSASGTFRINDDGETCRDPVTSLLMHRLSGFYTLTTADFQFEYLCQTTGERIRGSVIFDITLPPQPFNGPTPISDAIPSLMPTLQAAGGKLLRVAGSDHTLMDSNEVRFELKSSPDALGDALMHLEVHTPSYPSGLRRLLFEPETNLSNGSLQDRLTKGFYGPAGRSVSAINNILHRLEITECVGPWNELLGSVTIFDVQYDSEGNFEKLMGVFQVESCTDQEETVTYYLNYDTTLPSLEKPTPIALEEEDIPFIEEFSSRNTVMIYESDSPRDYVKTWDGLLDTNFGITLIENSKGFQVSYEGNNSRDTLSFIRSDLINDPNRDSPLEPGVYHIKPFQDGSGGRFRCENGGAILDDVKVTIFEIEEDESTENNALLKLSATIEFSCSYNDESHKAAYHIRHDLTKPVVIPPLQVDNSPLVPVPNNASSNFLVYDIEQEGNVQRQANLIGEDVSVYVNNIGGFGNRTYPRIVFKQGDETWFLLLRSRHLDLIPSADGSFEVGVYEILPQRLTKAPGAYLTRSITQDDCFTYYGGRLRIKSVENGTNNLPYRMTGDLELQCATEGLNIPFVKRASFGFDNTIE